MNKRKVLADLLFHLVLYFVGFVVVDLIRKHSHFNSRMLIEDGLGAIAASFGIVGIRELKRGGHQTTLRVLKKSIVSAFAISLILLGFMWIFKNGALELVFEFSLYLFAALIAATFPLALYLNRKQPEPTPQPTMTNAS